jgi:hypothetical protein
VRTRTERLLDYTKVKSSAYLSRRRTATGVSIGSERRRFAVVGAVGPPTHVLTCRARKNTGPLPFISTGKSVRCMKIAD